jgi:type I restriction enzyme S subunit
MMTLPYVKNQADERIKGIGVPDLHLNQISAFNIILPPLPLQQSFASKIEAIERQKALIQQSIAEVQMLFDSRMDDWFA